MNRSATILIAARNAASTIGRAVHSAVSQGDYPILLVDDDSTDATSKLASAAAAAGAGRLRTVRLPCHTTLGQARQRGLEALDTPYAVWLDADDELLPGRVERMVAALVRDDADIAADAAECLDGPTGSPRGRVPMPAFLKPYRRMARLFERNYLPGIGVIGVRADFARTIGYDTTLHGAEDVDFALRSIAAGARYALLDEVGYRIFAYPASLSRQVGNQRRMYRACLLKHMYQDVREMLLADGLQERIATWALVSMATFREEYLTALQFLDEAENRDDDPWHILEPDGPHPYPEFWRLKFHRGTLLLLAGRVSAAVEVLRDCNSLRPTPEGVNNLGVAYARAGERSLARECFLASLNRFPEFGDASRNLHSRQPEHITSHPLRRFPNRTDYRPLSGPIQQPAISDQGPISPCGPTA